MIKDNQYSLKQAIHALLKTYRLDGKMAEYLLISGWEKIVGQDIAKHTTDIYISKRQLFLKIDSSPLREELSYAKQQLIKKLNEEAGTEVITDIVFQ